MFEEAPSVNKFFGVVVGIVVDNKHPDGEYRIKVKFPWVRESDAQYTAGTPDDEDFFSTWCRVLQFMSGKDRGSFFLPEVDDEVLVAFEHGDMSYPVVLGAMWNGVDAPFYDNNAQDGKNCFSTIRTRSGHCLQFIDAKDDKTERIVIQTKIGKDECTTDHTSRDGHFICLDHTDGEEKIEIYDREQKNYILIDATNKNIKINCEEGDIDIFAGKNLNIETGEELNITVGTNMNCDVTDNLAETAGGQGTRDISGEYSVTGSKINLN